jgi:hypothetical protein
MTDREKAFAIEGCVRLSARMMHLRLPESKQLASVYAQHAVIPVELVWIARDESEVFGKIVTQALRRPVIGRWLARRAIKKAEDRAAICMSAREKAIEIDASGRIVELWLNKSPSHVGAMIAQSAWLVGLEPELVARVSEKTEIFMHELEAATNAESKMPTRP